MLCDVMKIMYGQKRTKREHMYLQVYKHVVLALLMSEPHGCQSIENLLREMERIALAMIADKTSDGGPLRAGNDAPNDAAIETDETQEANIHGTSASSILHRRLMSRVSRPQRNLQMASDNNERQEPYGGRRRRPYELRRVRK